MQDSSASPSFSVARKTKDEDSILIVCLREDTMSNLSDEKGKKKKRG